MGTGLEPLMTGVAGLVFDQREEMEVVQDAADHGVAFRVGQHAGANRLPPPIARWSSACVFRRNVTEVSDG